MKEFNLDERFEIQICLNRLKKLIESRILWEDIDLLYRRSVLIEVLIHLKQLLQKAAKCNMRISFTEDVSIDEELKIKDVTDLISNFRDAACHSNSPRLNYGNISNSFSEARNGVRGVSGENIKNSNTAKSDIIFIMGKNSLYLHKHIERAYNELEVIFRPLVFH